MKRHKRKYDIGQMLMVIALIVVGGMASYVITSNGSCTCSKISSTNIDVVDEDSLGAAVAFYLSKGFTVISSETAETCGEKFHKMSFVTIDNKQEELYVSDGGDIYRC